MTAIVTPTGLGEAVLDLLARGEDAWGIQEQARSVGGCEAPVRLRGKLHSVDRATGEMAEVWSTAQLPDGVQHVRCKNRRASRCEPCSKLYQGDAYQLILAGLVGGKGVPESIATHPALFVTLTAPSFGAVHTRNLNGRGEVVPCRARRDQAHQRCQHGQPVTCTARHHEADEALGQPLCTECFDYAGAVVWNATAGELWRRTRIRLYRELANLVGCSERKLRKQVSVAYVKVAEYQRRGLVHFHLVIRLDGVGQDDEVVAPPECFTTELLSQAIRAAVATTEAPYRIPTSVQLAEARAAIRHHHVPEVNLTPRIASVRWGAQVDIRPIVADTEVAVYDQASELLHQAFGPQVTVVSRGQSLSRAQVGGYLAKYATKHTECVGGNLDRRLKQDDLSTLVASAHVHRLVVAAWLLGKTDSEGNLGRWAHQLGFGGHFLTKSRRYSTTFRALRAARARWQVTQKATAEDSPEELEHEVIGRWELVGVGWRSAGDALLAKGVRNQAKVARQEVRQAKRELAEALALAG